MLCQDDGKIVCLVSHHEFLWPKISRLYVVYHSSCFSLCLTTVFTLFHKFKYDNIMLISILLTIISQVTSDEIMNLWLIFSIFFNFYNDVWNCRNKTFIANIQNCGFCHAWFVSSLGFGMGQKGRNGWISCWYIVALAINKVDSRECHSSILLADDGSATLK